MILKFIIDPYLGPFKEKERFINTNCLELCCGSGRCTISLFLGAQFKLYCGLDFNPRACVEFKKRLVRAFEFYEKHMNVLTIL